MAEIRSTIDIVMEKTRHMVLSDEEKKEENEKEFKGFVNGVTERFCDGSLSPGKAREQLDKLVETYKRSSKEIVDNILRRIRFSTPKRDQLILLLEQGYGIRVDSLSGLVQNCEEEVRSLTRKSVNRMRKELMKKSGISGSAVVPHLERDEKWLKSIQEISHGCEKKLESEKKRILERYG